MNSLVRESEYEAFDVLEPTQELSIDSPFKTWLMQIGLSQYLSKLEREGFDSVASMALIKESDLEAMEFKIAHRRRLIQLLSNNSGTL